MKIDVLSLFPDMFKGPIGESMIGKAIDRGILNLKITNFRDYSKNKHHDVDMPPYGGGAGMLLQPQPLIDAYQAVQKQNQTNGIPKGKVLLMDPAGKRFTQHDAEKLSHEKHLTFICGHYEGYDERIKSIVTDEYSLGDFVLTGGELPAMVMIDAISRLIPGVLGDKQSAPTDSFSMGLLEFPEYTRPADFRGMKVPSVLLSGDHQKIRLWREKQALKRTLLKRPDLLKKKHLSLKQKHMLSDIKLDLNDPQN
ncbi:MAG: tRNA (guanosine(37)-N1)-methyltransferase TrmD [Acetilactobacillus jinshanensis]